LEDEGDVGGGGGADEDAGWGGHGRGYRARDAAALARQGKDLPL
jgi:hypothetical protein